MPRTGWLFMRFSWPLIGLLIACSPANENLSVAAVQPSAAESVDRSVDSAKMDSTKVDDGSQLVQAHCGACHSLALVTQNRMTRDGWLNTIRWMQEKQGLWELGDAESGILDYLESNYGVVDVPWRRKPLDQSQQLEPRQLGSD